MNRRRFIRVGSVLVAAPLVGACEPTPRQAPPGAITPGGSPRTKGFHQPRKWEDFLEEWSSDAVEVTRSAGLDFSPSFDRFIEAGTLRRPPATAERIRDREADLGFTLPDTLKAFFQISDGWRSPWRESGWTVLPLSEVGWLSRVDPDLIRGWRRYRRLPSSDSRYFRYGPEQDPVDFRSHYLPRCIVLSNTWDDGSVLLLNTAITTYPSEVEAWELDHRLPGANRYRSFSELMEAIRQEELEGLRYWASEAS